MHSFHTLLYIFGIQSIKDTQCGFKMFTRKSAALIFSNMHVEGWIFDIEMLLLASWHNIPVGVSTLIFPRQMHSHFRYSYSKKYCIITTHLLFNMSFID